MMGERRQLYISVVLKLLKKQFVALTKDLYTYGHLLVQVRRMNLKAGVRNYSNKLHIKVTELHCAYIGYLERTDDPYLKCPCLAS
jgi:hypothetical protein